MDKFKGKIGLKKQQSLQYFFKIQKVDAKINGAKIFKMARKQNIVAIIFDFIIYRIRTFKILKHI